MPKGARGGSNNQRGNAALDAIKSKYPDSVIGQFQDGKVTFKFKDSPRSQEYTYNADNYEQLADRLRISYGNTEFEKSFFGKTEQVSNQYFKMSQQVSDDGNTIAFATKNIQVFKGSPMLITSPNEAIFLKDKQYEGVGIMNNKNGVTYTDAIMVKISRSEYDNAKRYTFKNGFGDIEVEKQSFDDLKKVAKAQQDGGNRYKKYSVAVYNDSIETSAGKKGRKIV